MHLLASATPGRTVECGPITETRKLNWLDTGAHPDPTLSLVNWENIVHYAIHVKTQRDGRSPTVCQLSSQYNKGGRNLVRRLDFQDGTRWVARIQLNKHTVTALQRLECEVHTMMVARERSKIPIPEVYAFETSCAVSGAPFILMDFIPGDTAMDFSEGTTYTGGRFRSSSGQSHTP